MTALRLEGRARWLLEETVSGGAYGLTAVLLSHPLDTLKTRRQAGPDLTSLRQLYRGLLPAAAGSVLFRAIPFAVYSAASGQLGARSDWLRAHPAMLGLAAGGWAGLGRSLVECPVEVLKVRQQLGQRCGLSGLYRGIGLTAARNVSVIGLFWALFEASREERERWCGGSAACASFVGGGCCSTAAWLCVYPVDVLKSRAQSGVNVGSHSSVVSILQGVVKEHGWSGLYRGLMAGLARSMVANGLAMVVYDMVSRQLRLGPAVLSND